MTDQTHFGYHEVARDAKAGLVRDVFDKVASRYDLMNDLMSGGIHRRWKDAAMDWLAPQPDQHLLDVAGGTGDIAFRFLERGGGGVTVCDINESM
jgi:demethylmenaquinone methyltransferase/2-methoxy-6-polyprenyl-1,4-benzoquinol methylase